MKFFTRFFIDNETFAKFMRIRDFLIGSCGIGVFFAGICSSYAQYPDVAVLLQSLGVGIDGDGNLAGNYEKERWKQFWSFLLKSQNDSQLEPFKNSFKEKAGSISSECCPYGFTESEYGVDTLCGGFLAGTGLYYDAEGARQIVDTIASRQFFEGVFGKSVTDTLIDKSCNKEVYTSLYCRGTFREYEDLLRESWIHYLSLYRPSEDDRNKSVTNLSEYCAKAIEIYEKIDTQIEYLKANVEKYQLNEEQTGKCKFFFDCKKVIDYSRDKLYGIKNEFLTGLKEDLRRDFDEILTTLIGYSSSYRHWKGKEICEVRKFTAPSLGIALYYAMDCRFFGYRRRFRGVQIGNNVQTIKPSELPKTKEPFVVTITIEQYPYTKKDKPGWEKYDLKICLDLEFDANTRALKAVVGRDFVVNGCAVLFGFGFDIYRAEQ